jgi:hypothetical protein
MLGLCHQIMVSFRHLDEASSGYTVSFILVTFLSLQTFLEKCTSPIGATLTMTSVIMGLTLAFTIWYYKFNDKYRMVLPVILMGSNVIIAVLAIIANAVPEGTQIGVSTYILFTLLIDFVEYFVIYNILRIVLDDKWPSRMVILFFVLVITCAFVGGHFYANGPVRRSGSQAQSREKNMDCILGDFYDNHDLWHFFSSLAVYFLALTLLVLDDDLSMENTRELTEVITLGVHGLPQQKSNFDVAL